MQIEYKCGRCDADVMADVVKSGPNNKLVCSKCKQYIKFISNDELESCVSMEDYKSDPNLIKEIVFKLDLILDHLRYIVQFGIGNKF